MKQYDPSAPRNSLPKGYVGVYEFARETGMDLGHIYKQLALGRLPGKKFGRKWGIPRKELEARKQAEVVG